MLVDKKTNHKKLDNDWKKVVQQGTQVLNDNNKKNKVDEYSKISEEIKTLQTALTEKETKLKKDKSSLTEVQDAINNDKASFADATKKGGWTATHTAFKDNYRGTGWNDLVKAQFPETYLDNLIAIDGQAFKITEDQATKILARIIYEIGGLERADFVANHGITATDNPDKATIEALFDAIVVCSGEIGNINTNLAKDKDGKEIGKKTWDLPFTFSEEQKVDNAGNNTDAIQTRYDETNSLGINFVDDLHQFIQIALKEETVAKLKAGNVTQKETNFDIYQSGDAYSEEQLKEFGIEVSNNEITTLYRSNLKYNETTEKWEKTSKMPISIQNGLKDWIKLYNSVFGDGDNFKDGKTNRAKLKKGFTNNPNILLFDDLSSQTGTTQPFTHNGTNYRLYEDLAGIKALERELLLGQNEKIEGIRKLQGEVDAEKRKITNKTSENKKVALEVVKITDEILEKNKESLKAYKLENGFDGDHKRDWLTLRKIHKLILEIRYLENNGDATQKCPFENDATNHCQTLIGTYNSTTNTITEEDLDTKLNVEGMMSEFYLVRYLKMLNHEAGVDKVINKIKNGEDDLLAGIDTKEKFELYYKHLDGVKKLTSLTPEELAFYKAIGKELGKDNQETISDWRTALGNVDNSLNDSTLITDTWKDAWTALGDKFKKAENVKTLLDKVKGKSDFIAQTKVINASWTSLKEILKEKPKEVIALIALYEFEKLDDTSKIEKDKKKTQQKRRIAVKLGKTKDTDISLDEIKDSLVKIETGELVFSAAELAKFYNASLQEIKDTKEETPSKDILRWDNPWLYLIGALLIGGTCAIIWWDKVVAWYNGPVDEQVKVKDETDDDNDEDDD